MAFRFSHALQFQPESLIRLDAGHVPPLNHRPDVLPGSANQNRQSAARADFFDGAKRAIEKSREGHRLIGVQAIDEMVWNCRKILSRRFCRTDIQPSIELARIGVDDLSAKLSRKMESKRRLPDSSRAYNCKEGKQLASNRCNEAHNASKIARLQTRTSYQRAVDVRSVNIRPDVLRRDAAAVKNWYVQGNLAAIQPG